MKIIKYIITSSVLATAMFFIASCAATTTTPNAAATGGIAMVRVQAPTDTDQLGKLEYFNLKIGDKSISVGATISTVAINPGTDNAMATYVEIPSGEVKKLTLEARVGNGTPTQGVNFLFGPDVAVTGITDQGNVSLTGKAKAAKGNMGYGTTAPTAAHGASTDLLLKHDGKLNFVGGKKYTITLDATGSVALASNTIANGDLLKIALKVTEDAA